jgi:LDH2 family malate/lactate/ureidoglycolate dehydrogenase
VLVAGDPEWRTESERREKGIPMAEGNWEALCKAAGKLGVPAPVF